MITFELAHEIVTSLINKNSLCGECVIINERIIDLPYAWIFPYTSKKYLETGNIMEALGGNGPVFVSKMNGGTSTYRTGLSLAGMIDEHEERNKHWELILISAPQSVGSWQILKKTLGWSQPALTQFKSSRSTLLDNGARSRLEKIRAALTPDNIETEILLKTVE